MLGLGEMLGRGEGLPVGTGEVLGGGEDDGDGVGEGLAVADGMGKGLGAVVIKTLICSTGWPPTVCWPCSTVTMTPAGTTIVRIMLAVVIMMLVMAIQCAMQSSDQQ